MIGIIGCGNMGQAIIKGFYSKHPDQKFMTWDPDTDKAQSLADSINGERATSLADLQKVSHLVLACKPQHLNSLAEDFKKNDMDLKEVHIISILAGTATETIQQKLDAAKVTRVMPNTPALFSEAMSLIFHASQVTENEHALTEKFFKACGEIAYMPDELTFDRVTTVSGSGPAYVFLFAEAMVNQLQEWDIEQSAARKIVMQLFKGSTLLMQNETETPLPDLIDRVCSKGGVTIEAVNVFRDSGLRETTAKALKKAETRAMELRDA